MFHILRLKERMNSIEGDVRDLQALHAAFKKVQPEIVFHLAAQPLVRESYKNPVYTYETNVMGTVNLMECVRACAAVKSVVNVTTDKVYQNKEWCWGYRETDVLDGYDPYSNSKSCSELVSHSYQKSFLAARGVAVSTVRAGNVIGGGDFSADRILPDCVRAAGEKRIIVVRNPYSVRPYQHVLDPLAVYLAVAQAQYENKARAGSYNVGPNEQDCVSTGTLADLFCRYWGDGAAWENVSEENAPHEAGLLKLDCSLIKSVFGWKPCWNVEQSVRYTCEWGKAWLNGGDMWEVTQNEIKAFLTAA